MHSIEDIILECERDSFRKAAQVAKEKGTQLVFEEDGKIISRHPNPEDISGNGVELLKISGENHNQTNDKSKKI